ncbi:ribose ABC transporter permease [Synergistales bacterium]|nr:ribose ABC transporter permease [Synergistales bacterium]
MRRNLLAALNPSKNIYTAPIIIILVMFGLGQMLMAGFMSVNNIGNVLTVSCLVTIAAIAQTLVLLIGGDGIDLSVGAVMSMSALIGPVFCGGDASKLPLAIAAVVCIACVIGAINATGVQFFKIPPLIMTLIMSGVVDGFALAFTRGQPSGSIPKIMLNLGRTVWGPVRWLLLVTVVIIVFVELFLRKSRLGRSIYLVGSNRMAAKLSGISINKTLFFAYMAGSSMAALGGFLLVGYSGSAMLKMASSYTMLSVAASVIGGTQLTGGKGTMTGGFLGAIIFTILTNILTALNLPGGVRTLIQGTVLLIILAVYTRGEKLRN